MAEAVRTLAQRARYVAAVGTCASFGGIPARSDVTGAQSVGQFLGRGVLNIPGCPPHPDWIIGTLAQLLSCEVPALDELEPPPGLLHARADPRALPPPRDGGGASLWRERPLPQGAGLPGPPHPRRLRHAALEQRAQLVHRGERLVRWLHRARFSRVSPAPRGGRGGRDSPALRTIQGIRALRRRAVFLGSTRRTHRDGDPHSLYVPHRHAKPDANERHDTYEPSDCHRDRRTFRDAGTIGDAGTVGDPERPARVWLPLGIRDLVK